MERIFAKGAEIPGAFGRTFQCLMDHTVGSALAPSDGYRSKTGRCGAPARIAGVGTVSNFNKLWLGQTISLLGSAMTQFALPTLAVLVLHATPVQLGTLIALETLPFPILGMIVGVVVDRLSRRQIMIAADLIRFAVLVSVPIAALSRVLGMPQLYAVALLSGTASAFFGIAYQSYLPALVPAERLTDANAKLEFSNSGAAMAGMAAAGILVQFVGAAFAIAADAVSYLASVASLLTIRAPEDRSAKPSLSLRQAVREIGEGLRVVFGSNDLRWILCATATTNFGGAMIMAVFFIYAYRGLHLQPGILGVVDGFANVGFVGALFAVRIRNRYGLRATLAGSLLVAGAGSMAILLAGVAVPYAVLFVQGAMLAIAVPIYNINQVSYRQALVDARLQGRMNATMRAFVWGTMPLGSLVGGWLGGVAGAPATIAAGALLSCAAAVFVLPLKERYPLGKNAG
ncbi:MAG TPA: MFS transporter [Candidatus Tumulicola sp.]|jgi:MFS family permease